MKMDEILSEGAYEAGVNDGLQGNANPRASSVYGSSRDEYDSGYSAGKKQRAQQAQQAPAADVESEFAVKLKSLSNDDLLKVGDKADAKMREIVAGAQAAHRSRDQDAAKKYKSASDELKVNITAIARELMSRGIYESASAGATSAGAVASVSNPKTSKTKKGVKKNAIDSDDNLMSGKYAKR